MSKGFGSGSSKKKINVKQIILDKRFAEGEELYFAKNYSKAELIFLKLIDSGYENPSLFLYLSNIYIFNGSDEKAKICLKTALVINPDNPNIYFSLATIHFKRNEFDLAKSYLLQGLNLDPKNSFALSNLAGCYEELLEFKDAVENYKKAFFLNKNLLQTREKLIDLQPKICDWSLYRYFEAVSYTHLRAHET